MKKILSAAIAAVTAASAFSITIPETAIAENPVVQTSFTPDPAPVVFGDELYVFTGCDRDGDNDFYKMTGWQCFSTKDMKNWTDHGRILEDTSFSWCGANDAWASQCIERNGRYYFYFTTTNKSGGGRAIGVAVADSPEGPYKDVLGKPLCGPNWNYIDPTVMIDDDGQAWLMFGNPTCYYVKLKDDMITLDGEIKSFDMTEQAFGPHTAANSDDKRTCAYGEGPWICKHDNLYYLVYAAFVGKDSGESMAYATGPSPTGPWTYRGQIQKGSNCYTIHGGIVDYKDHSYYFYHMNGIPGGGVFNRSAACEEFTFNSDGSIPNLPSTSSGPEQLEALDPFVRVEAETICWCEGVKTEKCSEGGLNIGNIGDGSYIKVSGVDFGEGADKFTASVASASNGGNIEIHLDSKTGPVVGLCRVSGTGGWQSWEEVSCDVSGANGEHDLYFVFKGSDTYLLNVDWWKFSGPGGASSGDSTYFFRNGFENSTDGWSGRGAAKVSYTSDESYAGGSSAFVSGRTASWNGIGKNLGYKFKAGESYSFSANVKYSSGEPTNTFHFTLQYNDANGEPVYKKIDTKTVPKGEWTQLSNTGFTIPEGAKNCYIYVETEGDDGIDFYVDDIAAAVSGTVIAGAGSPDVSVIPGDLNFDGIINVFDMIIARKTYVSKFSTGINDKKLLKAADVDGNGDYTIADMVQIANFLLGRSKKFEETASKTTTSATTTTTITTTTGKTPNGNYMDTISNDMQINAPDSFFNSRSGVDYGKSEVVKYFSEDGNCEKSMTVILPPGYSENEKYPVLYVLHGIGGDHNSMPRMGVQTMLGNLIADGKSEKMIIVCPSMLTGQGNPMAFNQETMRMYDLIREDIENSIMPYMEQHYSIKTGRENTAITGFSLGGREALYCGITHSQNYGYVGSACAAPGIFPTVDTFMTHEGSLKQESEFKPSVMPEMILISAAQNDGVVGTYPESYHNALTGNGVQHLWQIIPQGDHGNETVKPHMYNFLRYVFKAE